MRTSDLEYSKFELSSHAHIYWLARKAKEVRCMTQLNCKINNIERRKFVHTTKLTIPTISVSLPTSIIENISIIERMCM